MEKTYKLFCVHSNVVAKLLLSCFICLLFFSLTSDAHIISVQCIPICTGKYEIGCYRAELSLLLVFNGM